VWVIGHNPTMEELTERLSHRRVGLGTAHAVLLELDADAWPEALARPWQFVDLVAPAGP
jgi:phosphohistidine phosphatase SixA